MQSIEQKAYHILGKTEFRYLIRWTLKILDNCREYERLKESCIFILTRKSEILFDVMIDIVCSDELQNDIKAGQYGDELKDLNKDTIRELYLTKFIAEDSLFESVELLVDFYSKYKKLPRLIVVSEQLFHGRTLNSLILRLYECIEIQASKSGLDNTNKESILKEFKVKLNIEVYSRCDGVLLLIFEYGKENKLRVYKNKSMAEFMEFCLGVSRLIQVQQISRMPDTWAVQYRTNSNDGNHQNMIETFVEGYKQLAKVERLVENSQSDSYSEIISILSEHKILQVYTSDRSVSNTSMIQAYTILNKAQANKLLELLNKLNNYCSLGIERAKHSDAYNIKYAVLLLNAIKLSEYKNKLISGNIETDSLNLIQLNRHYSVLKCMKHNDFEDIQLDDKRDTLYTTYKTLEQLSRNKGLIEMCRQVGLYNADNYTDYTIDYSDIDLAIWKLAVKDEQQAYNRYSGGLALSNHTLAAWGDAYQAIRLKSEITKEIGGKADNNTKYLDDKFIQLITHYISLGYLESYYNFEHIDTGRNFNRAVGDKVDTMFKTS